MRLERAWLGVLAVLVGLAAACGGDDDDQANVERAGSSSSAEAESSPNALQAVRTAAEAVRSAGTGRFDLVLEVRNMPGVPDGPLGTKHGTYDIRGERLEIRWVLSDSDLGKLQSEEAIAGEPGAGSRESPHVVSLWSKTDGLLFRVPAQGTGKWIKMPEEQLEAGAARFGISLADAAAGAGPPMIGALLDAPGPADDVPARADDPPNSRRYTVQLGGGSGLDLLTSGAFLNVFESLDQADQQKLLEKLIPADVLVVDDRVAAVDLNLKELFLDLLRAAAPEATEEEEEIRAFAFVARTTIFDVGAAVDLPIPGPGEVVSPEEAGITLNG